MTIHHHPSDETLARFAAGTLAAGPTLVVETHLADCRRCRGEVDGMTAVAAAMVSELPPSPMSEDALAHAMARIDRATEIERPASAPRGRIPKRWPPGVAVPQTLEQRDIGRWMWLGPGVRVSRVAVPEDREAYVILLWVQPGTRLPEHGHAGTEFTHVIKGSYSDGVGRYFPGDLLEAGADFDHRPVVDPDGDCLCIAAIDGHVRFRGWLGRLLQPFMPSEPAGP